MSSLVNLSLGEMHTALRAGDTSSRELTQAFLKQIDILEPSLHAFLTLTPEEALAQADDADSRIRDWRADPGGYLPVLVGIPIVVKDVLCVKDVCCTCGSRILENYIPPFDATAVKRLRAAGVVILGKTNTDEFAMGSSTENSAYGPTHNPWNLERVPGGSSGGSAVAVAARLVPVSLGTDTGGSVRQPASFCGVTGIKPTYGRVSRYGLIAYGSSLDVVGAMGRTAADIVPLFLQMAGYDPLDATTVDLPVNQFTLQENGRNESSESPLQGVRIGVPDEYFIAGMEADVESGVRQAIQEFESLGARAKRISLPHTEYAVPVYYIIAPAEASANLARYDGIRYGPRISADEMWEIFRGTRGLKFGPEVKRRIMLGTYALSAGYYEAYYGQAQKVRTLIKQDFENAFEEVDVIAAPVAPTTAFDLGEHSDDPLSMYLEDIFTLPANLAGVPGITFPVCFDHQGLPVGIQMMGPHFKEGILFQIAHAYQQVTEWHTHQPNLSSDC